MVPRLLRKRRSAEEVTVGADLRGRVAVVTGCTSGIGYETMRVLALRGAHVFGTGRNIEKAGQACSGVPGMVTPVALELADPGSVVAAATAIAGAADVIDIVVCNAGTLAPARLQLLDGVEKTFATNHLGHFRFVHWLLPSLIASREGRVIVVSSDVAYRQWLGGIDFDALRGRGRYQYMRAYGQSKLANALFSKELARRLRRTAVVSHAVSPGFVRTNIPSKAPTTLRWMMKLAGPLLARTPAQGAATSCYVATAAGIRAMSGEFFENCVPRAFGAGHPLNDAEMAARLWRVSEEMTGVTWRQR